MTTETETIAALVGILGLVAGGVWSLPWTSGELRGSARAMATLTVLPALAVGSAWAALRSAVPRVRGGVAVGVVRVTGG